MDEKNTEDRGEMDNNQLSTVCMSMPVHTIRMNSLCTVRFVTICTCKDGSLRAGTQIALMCIINYVMDYTCTCVRAKFVVNTIKTQ